MTTLASLRTDMGMTQAQAAEAIGISRALLGFYETGERPVPADVEARLHTLYGAAPEPGDVPAAPSVLLRSNQDSLNPTARGELNILDQVLGLYVELLSHFGASASNLIDSPFESVPARVNKSDAEYRAREARRWVEAVGGPPGDTIEAVDRAVLLFQLPLGGDLSTSPSGFFFKHARAGLTVVVNSDMVLGRQQWSAAHELAHALFHSQTQSGLVSPGHSHAKDGRERFADQFAAEFILPGDDVRAVVHAMPSWGNYAPVQQRVLVVQREFGCSFQAAAYRMRNLDLIGSEELDQALSASPSAVARTMGWPSSPLDQRIEIVDRLGGFPAGLQWILRAGIEDGVVTVGDVAETAAVSTESVMRMFAPVDDADIADPMYERFLFS